MYVGIFVMAAAGIARIFESSRLRGSTALTLLLAINLGTCYFPTRAIPGEPFVFRGERVSHDHSELLAGLEAMGISLVRTNYWIGYRLAFETKERVKFLVFDEPEHVRIPEYEDSVPELDHDVVPLLLVPGQAVLARRALAALGFTFQERVLSNYVLIYDIRRSDAPMHLVPRHEIAGAQAFGKQDPAGAFDGDLRTRWGTGAPQAPGQSFRVELKRGVSLVGIGYQIGEFRHDYPRGLTIEVEGVDGSVHTVLTPELHAVVHYYTDHESFFRLVFSPINAKAVILHQTGKHPILDWSIAELRLYSDEG